MPAGARITRLSSRAGRILAALVALICIGSEVHYFAAQQTVEGERLIPMFAFITFVAWLVLWRPTVEIGESGITVVNPLRTYRLAWPTLLSTEGRYFLTLVTSDRKISVWAAPRQRRGVTGIDVRRDSFGLPDYAAEQQFERQSSATSVGEVAEQLIARRRAEPVLDTLNSTSGAPVETRFHMVSFVVLVVLLATTGVAFAIH